MLYWCVGVQWTLGRSPIHGWIYDSTWLASLLGKTSEFCDNHFMWFNMKISKLALGSTYVLCGIFLFCGLKSKCIFGQNWTVVYDSTIQRCHSGMDYQFLIELPLWCVMFKLFQHLSQLWIWNQCPMKMTFLSHSQMIICFGNPLWCI